MVQSISTVDFSGLISSVDSTGKTDNEEIKNTFGAALSAAIGSDGKTEASSDKKDTEGLMEDLKKLTKGLTICGKCGAIYQGTSVAKCSKCGHDMKEDSDNASKMQGNSDVQGTSALAAASLGVTGTAIQK